MKINFTQKDYALFKEIASLKEDRLMLVMKKFLEKTYQKVISTSDYLLVEGEIPIAVVAHMDTVFDKPPVLFYRDTEKNVIFSPDGLGADDRSGIFLIIKLIQAGYRPAVILTMGEEEGCLGAQALVRDYNKAPFELNYIIELDRRGANDCVFYGCHNADFVTYVENFGFIENYGTFSDISAICPTWGIAGVNLSVGYEDEHSYVETLHTNHLMHTLNRVKEMLDEKDIPKFTYNQYSYMDKYLPNYTSYIKCDGCKEMYEDNDMIDVKHDDGTIKHYCIDCCSNFVGWCKECGEVYDNDFLNSPLCPTCRKKEGGDKCFKKFNPNSTK